MMINDDGCEHSSEISMAGIEIPTNARETSLAISLLLFLRTKMAL
jgi:hypothetical protein